MKRMLTVVAAVVFLGLAPLVPASASTLTFSGTTLTAVRGLPVDGSFYDVAFVDGTCAGIFSDCDALSDFVFSSETNALAAAQALVNAIGSVDPVDTFGCSTDAGAEQQFCDALIPYAFGEFGLVSVAEALNFAEGGPFADIARIVGYSVHPTLVDTSGDPGQVWAKFTPSVAAVPEPTTQLLFGLGLAGSGMLRWRLRKTT